MLLAFTQRLRISELCSNSSLTSQQLLFPFTMFSFTFLLCLVTIILRSQLLCSQQPGRLLESFSCPVGTSCTTPFPAGGVLGGRRPYQERHCLIKWECRAAATSCVLQPGDRGLMKGFIRELLSRDAWVEEMEAGWAWPMSMWKAVHYCVRKIKSKTRCITYPLRQVKLNNTRHKATGIFKCF